MPWEPVLSLPMAEAVRLYRDGLSPREIAKAFGCSTATVARRLRKSGVRMRNGSEAANESWRRGRVPSRYWLGKKQPRDAVARRAAKLTGEGNGRWKDGSQRRGYRTKIKKKKCGACGTRERLGIHHKNGDHFDNRIANLSVLCLSCHMRHHKREWWKAKKAGKPLPKSNARIGWLG